MRLAFSWVAASHTLPDADRFCQDQGRWRRSRNARRRCDLYPLQTPGLTAVQSWVFPAMRMWLFYVRWTKVIPVGTFCWQNYQDSAK